MTETRRRRALLATLGLLAAALVAYVVWGMPRALPDAPLRVVPDDAVAIASVRVHDVLHSRFVRDLAGGALDDAGMDRVQRTCGFNPLERVAEATVFVTGDEADGLDRLGFVARGPRLASEELARCVRTAVRSDGGGVREVTIEGVRAIAPLHGTSRAAFVGADGVTGGSEESVAGVLRTFHGDQRSADGDPVLHDLWAQVATSSRDVVAVAHVPSRWRNAVRARLGDDPRLATLSRVRAIALGATLATEASVSVVLRTDDAPSAAALVSAARALRASALENPLATFTPAGRALAALQLDAEGHDAVLTIDLDADEARALGRAIAESFAEPEPPASPAPTPDEVMRAGEP